MFIVWGESDHEETLGVVAGKCAGCGAIARMTLGRLMRRPHVYFLPVGRGTAIAVVVTCRECNRKVTLSRAEYPDFVTEADAERMTLDELLDETNPELANLLQLRPTRDPRPQIQDGPAHAERGRSEAERLADVRDRLVDAVARGHRRLDDIRWDLSRWNELDSIAQRELLVDAETILNVVDSQRRFERFANWASDVLNGVSHRVRWYLLIVVLVGAPVLLAALLWVHIHGPVKRDDQAGFVLACTFATVVPILLLTMFVELRRIRGVRKDLIRTKLLPNAEQHRIDLADFRDAVMDAHEGNWDSPNCDGLQSFAHYLDLWDEILAEKTVVDDRDA